MRRHDRWKTGGGDPDIGDVVCECGNQYDYDLEYCPLCSRLHPALEAADRDAEYDLDDRCADRRA